MTYILTSLTLAILMPLLLAGSGHQEIGKVATYRYPRGVCWFFLGALPVYGAMGIFIYSTMSPQDKSSIPNMATFGTVWICILGLIVFAYFYFKHYRIQIDDHLLTLNSILGKKFISLASVAQIAVLRGRATDLMLFGSDDHLLIKIGGSLQDFESFLSQLKLRTRSPQVTLFKWDRSGKWYEAINSGAEHWVDSKGPKRFRDMNRHLKFILITGLPLIAIAALVAWFNSRS
ncbi:hypothetical protein [Dyella sp. A6]|uniref:hypothetical protein n=1 Tax=Dyella aluminiiresistens TaxID=3069105 RepID=UPI002E79CF7E|nr:hypothetical protein [Dyella sp. A6]